MRAFVDTSALYALLDESDANHAAAAEAFSGLRGSELSTHSYVLVETLALVSRRLGRAAVERFLDGLLPVITVAVVDPSLHAEALADDREANSIHVSFVDRTSFAFMRTSRLDVAFAFDAHFSQAGFDLVPSRP
jgi:predicted nucleic acid-binding protein